MAARTWKDAVELPVEQIAENDWNPNAVDPVMFAQLVENIRVAGFNQPIVVRQLGEDVYEVVDGAHRFRAAQQLGMKKVPAVVRDFTEAQAKGQTLAMNRLRGDMDPAGMARLIREIESDGIPLDEFATFSGFTGDDVAGLYADFPELPGGGSGPPAESSGRAGRGDPVIGYNLIFDDREQQEVWYRFVRHLRAHYTGETIAERLTTFLLEVPLDTSEVE